MRFLILVLFLLVGFSFANTNNKALLNLKSLLTQIQTNKAEPDIKEAVFIIEAELFADNAKEKPLFFVNARAEKRYFRRHLATTND